MKLGVIGYPVEHSLSPELFQTRFFVSFVKGTYEKISVPLNENLYTVLLDLYLDGYDGVNVTMPYKEKVIGMVTHLGDCAEKVKAINTIVFNDDKWVGYNTDYLAYKILFEKNVSVFDKILIIGAGGAARAIAYAAMDVGFKSINITNRTPEPAKQLAGEVGGNVVEMDFKPVGDMVIVNATSMGMNGENVLDIDFSQLGNGSVICDVVYQPKITKIIENANIFGLQTIMGYDMLIRQAEISFSLFRRRKCLNNLKKNGLN
jgi:shikimate dehydrogenase